MHTKGSEICKLQLEASRNSRIHLEASVVVIGVVWDLTNHMSPNAFPIILHMQKSRPLRRKLPWCYSIQLAVTRIVVLRTWLQTVQGATIGHLLLTCQFNKHKKKERNGNIFYTNAFGRGTERSSDTPPPSIFAIKIWSLGPNKESGYWYLSGLCQGAVPPLIPAQSLLQSDVTSCQRCVKSLFQQIAPL